MWEKAKDFLQRAFTVILIATIVVWFLKSFNFQLQLVEEADSMLAAVGNVLAPLFKPVGLGDWRLVTSLICGFMAKESVVSVMGVLFGSGLISLISPLSVASMLVFCLLYTPCVAAIAAIRREMGGKWAVFAVIWQCALAWIAAFAVRLIGLLFGVG
jgi:ferrous iron transport protein B